MDDRKRKGYGEGKCRKTKRIWGKEKGEQARCDIRLTEENQKKYNTIKAEFKLNGDDAKSNNVWFQEMGELVMTDRGGFFFYGHPFIKRLI